MPARRIARGAIVLVLSAVALAVGSACAGSTPAEPTLPSVNFSPKVLIEIRPDGLHYAKGPREDRELLLDPPTFGSGTVSEITNATTTDQRLQGDNGKVFDTGILRPGDKTTVVFTNSTAEQVTVAVTDTRDPTIKGTIVVRPKPTA
jgi:hypothetical protein